MSLCYAIYSLLLSGGWKESKIIEWHLLPQTQTGLQFTPLAFGSWVNLNLRTRLRLVRKFAIPFGFSGVNAPFTPND